MKQTPSSCRQDIGGQVTQPRIGAKQLGQPTNHDPDDKRIKNLELFVFTYAAFDIPKLQHNTDTQQKC